VVVAVHPFVWAFRLAGSDDAAVSIVVREVFKGRLEVDHVVGRREEEENVEAHRGVEGGVQSEAGGDGTLGGDGTEVGCDGAEVEVAEDVVVFVSAGDHLCTENEIVALAGLPVITVGIVAWGAPCHVGGDMGGMGDGEVG
jgi:hypothetical protein